MKMNDISFDPLDVRTRINPFSPTSEPFKIDAWQFIGQTVYLDPRRVKFMEGQPREEFSAILRLARGLMKQGQKTAIQVHPINHPDYDVELQAGERRTRACMEAGLMVRSEIRPIPTDRKEHYVDAVVENFNRHDLTLLESVKAVTRLLADGHSIRDIVVMSGKTYAWVSQYASLGKLDVAVLQLLGGKNSGQRNERGRKLRRTSALSLSIALQVVKLPTTDQLPFAQMLIDEGIPIDISRGMVRRRLAEAGEHTVRERPAKEVFDVLVREIQRVEGIIGRYLEMTQPKRETIFQAQEKDRRKNLAEKMMALASQFETMAEVVDPFEIRPWMWHPALQVWLKKQIVTREECEMS